MNEYDSTDPSLGQAFANILRGVTNPQQWQEAGQGIVNTAQVLPNVVESLARGGVAQAVGTMGDLRDLRNTVQSYLPQSIQNWSNAAEFMTNPYAKALIQTAPTTEKTLETVPRITPTYEGAGQHETLGEYIAPSLGYFGEKAFKLGKNLPVGLSIEDVTPSPAKVAEALRQPEKNALGFYSPLEEAVLGLKNEKGTGQQYLNQLLKTVGVKQEEVATRGLDTFLNENPKVSKEQLINYLRENPVELRETVKTSDTPNQLNSMNYEDYRLNESDPIDDPDYIAIRAEDIASELKTDDNFFANMRDELLAKDPDRYMDWENNPSAFERLEKDIDAKINDEAYATAEAEYWDNPLQRHTDEFGFEVIGNDDLGFSIKDPEGNWLRHSFSDINEAEDFIREEALNQGLIHYSDEEYGTKYHDYTLPNGENYREVLIQYEPKQSFKDQIRELTPEDKARLGVDSGVLAKVKDTWGYYHSRKEAEDILRKRLPEYTSGHFDEPNILAHFRTTDRTIDGKKTLFVEEIQSDWHQQGRKHGYAAPLSNERKMEIRLELDKLNDMKSYARSQRDAAKAEGLDTTNEDMRLANIERQQVELRSELTPKGVPDAPFKKNWQELAMKRAMQMAAEGGYDRVAFTTGKQQADRYSLSKHINELTYNPKTKQLWAYKEGNYSPVISKTVEPDDLPDVIGKEAAKKLLETEMTPLITNNGEEFAHQLTGQALDVGGEGMKGFYDKILPDFINKYGKKHGLKVGKTNIDPDALRHDLTDEQLAAGLEKIGMTSRKYYELPISERSPIYQRISKEFYPSDKNDVHYFDLTPEAKESFLKKGQPMFAVAPALAITDEDSRREVLEKLFNSKK